MSFIKSITKLRILAAGVVAAGVILLAGCEQKKNDLPFPESIGVAAVETALTGAEVKISPESFIVNPDGLTLTCSFIDLPVLSEAKDYNLKIQVTAENGAKKTFDVVLTVYEDKEAPVISGVTDKRFNVTDKVSYVKGISATDNHDGDVKVNVDNSAIKFDEKNQPIPGQYKVVYTATDKAGNVATAEALFIFSLENITDEMINEAVKGVLDRIITPDMSPADKAWVIYLYAYRNVEYTGKSEKGDYRAEAYRGIVNKVGDCFTYHSVSKALLLAAGITDIIDVTRAPGGPNEAEHYWLLVNLGSGYYHFDTTRKHEWQDGFMQTDAQLEEYENKSKELNGFFYRDKSLYPETPKQHFEYAKDYNLVK